MPSIVWGQSPSLSAPANEAAEAPVLFQGRLTEGEVTASGAYDFQFALYTEARAGRRLAELVKDGVAVKEGMFRVSLDFGQLDLLEDKGWLEIAVRKSGTAEAYVVITPRRQLKLEAHNRDAARDVKTPLSATAPQSRQSGQDYYGTGWTHDGKVLRLTNESDNVGIGVANPVSKLEVAGDIRATGSVKTGNSLSISFDHTITVTTEAGQPYSKQLHIGYRDPANPGPFSDIKVGIGTQAPREKLSVFDPQSPVIELDSGVASTRLSVATCAFCYSAVATPGDTILSVYANASEDLLLTTRNNNNGAIRFTTGTTAFDVERMTILNDGRVGIGTVAPPTLFAVGNNNPFRVDGFGNLVRVNNIPYSWPAAQGATNTVLGNDGAGNLSWVPPSGGGGVSGSCGSGANFVTKWSSTSAIACSQIFDNGTRVGIGTVSPQTRFHVSDTVPISGLAAMRVDFINPTASGSALGLTVESPALNNTGNNTGVRARTSVNGGFQGFSEGRMAESARFGSVGRLAGVVGISAPSSLSINSSGISFAVGGLFQNTPPTPPVFYRFPTGTVWVGGVYGEIANTFNANPPTGAIAAVIGVDNSNGTARRWAGYFVGKAFFSNNVGIGNLSPTERLHVNGRIRVDLLNTGGQPLCWDAGHVLSLCGPSDARLKTNILPLTNSLDKLARIRGVTFEWNEASRPLVTSTGRREIGVLAQEVEAVLPELVSESPEGYKLVDYSKIAAVLIEAVKELKAENESLKRRLEALEAAAKR